MELFENKYENTMLLALPPNARDIAENFLKTRSLSTLLQAAHLEDADSMLLNDHHVNEKYWLPIIKAALMAKVTSMQAGNNLTHQQLLFLIKTACFALDYPTEQLALKDLVEYSHLKEMPVLHQWLVNISEKLINHHANTK